MCGNCAGAVAATVQPGRTLQTFAVPVPGSGTLLLNLPTAQPLPAVSVTAKPFPWGKIILAAVLFVVLTKGGR